MNKRFSANDAINHVWIIKLQKIKNSLIKKIVGKNKCNLISLLNNYAYKEDNVSFKNNKIFLDFSTKDSEDKEKDKIFTRLKRKRLNDEDKNDANINNI